MSAPGVEQLGTCYKQLNSSVGDFGTSTLILSTRGLESQSPGDWTYNRTEAFLTQLDRVRDRVAEAIKGSLEQAAFSDTQVRDLWAQDAACQFLIRVAVAAAR